MTSNGKSDALMLLLTMRSWQESLFFQSVAHVGAFLMVEVMQEERVRCDKL